MSQKIRTTAKAVCPFYEGEENRRIHHQKLKSNGNIILSYKSNEAFEKYKAEYCENIKAYEKCPIYKAMLESEG